MSDLLTIAARFNGPPDSANGGYVCGALAGLLDAPVTEVTLRRPPPLDVAMPVERDDTGVRMMHGSALVAEGRATHLGDVDVPAAPTLDAARDAAAHFRGHEAHLFPKCYVCGPLRADGLRIFPGPVGEVIAAPWTPATEYDVGNGTVDLRIVWSALDCSGGWANSLSPSWPAVLGRMAVEHRRPVPVGADLVVIGWSRGADGRKLYAGSAVCDPSGNPYAVGVATWISLPAAG